MQFLALSAEEILTMKKVLVVNDDLSVLTSLAELVKAVGGSVVMILQSEEGCPMATEPEWAPMGPLDAVREAEIIFLDHRMPRRNGEELLKFWKELGIDLSRTRIIGTSTDEGSQGYLLEQVSIINSPEMRVENLAKFLDISD